MTLHGVKTKYLIIVMTLVLAFTMICACFYIACESEHECEGDDCAVCELIHYFENVLYRTDSHTALCVVVAAIVCHLMHALIMTDAFICKETPVSRKVRMDT